MIPMHLPKICTNKFFLMAITASFAFTMSMYNILDNSVHEVKGDFFKQSDEIKQKIDLNSQKIENLLVSQARIEQKIDNLTP